MSFPTTRPSVLSRMRRGDDKAWGSLFEQYAVPSLGFLRRLGLSEADAKDIRQEALLKLPRVVQDFDRNSGTRFHSFLITVLRNSFRDWTRARNAKRRDARKTLSYDAPLSVGDAEGIAQLERFEDERIQHFVKSKKAVQDSLDKLLQDYPDEKDKRIYLDWFWKDDETDGQIAVRHRLKLAQLRYIRKKVEAHLQKRAAKLPLEI